MEINKINELSIREVFKDRSGFVKWFETEEVKKVFKKLVGMELGETTEWYDFDPDFDVLYAKDIRYSLSSLFFINYNSDHKKAIGNLMTLISKGASEESIVWIADNVTDDDRDLFQWLNWRIDGTLMFYLVELHFFSVKGSDPAYQLRTVYEPNYDGELYKMKMESRREFLEVIGELNKNEVKTDS